MINKLKKLYNTFERMLCKKLEEITEALNRTYNKDASEAHFKENLSDKGDL